MPVFWGFRKSLSANARLAQHGYSQTKVVVSHTASLKIHSCHDCCLWLLRNHTLFPHLLCINIWGRLYSLNYKLAMLWNKVKNGKQQGGIGIVQAILMASTSIVHAHAELHCDQNFQTPQTLTPNAIKLRGWTNLHAKPSAWNVLTALNAADRIRWDKAGKGMWRMHTPVRDNSCRCVILTSRGRLCCQHKACFMTQA